MIKEVGGSHMLSFGIPNSGSLNIVYRIPTEAMTIASVFFVFDVGVV
jgi:hypothetical protein